MSSELFRGAQHYGLDAMREWMRQDCPSGSNGFVPIDIDLALRTYGYEWTFDGDGMLMVVEKKEQYPLCRSGQLTQGASRVYQWLHKAVSSGAYRNRWRGCHLLVVQYADTWPNCPHCGQDIRTDAELAYQMFISASLTWDGKPITHKDLRDILLNGHKEAA